MKTKKWKFTVTLRGKVFAEDIMQATQMIEDLLDRGNCTLEIESLYNISQNRRDDDDPDD